MLDRVVVFFVKEMPADGDVSEVYVPAVRVLQGSVEPHVLSLVGIDLERTKVIRYMDRSSVIYTLIIDLAAVKDMKGHLKVIPLDEADDTEMGILYEAYLAERLSPYFREAVSNKVCQWAGKNRIVSAVCSDSIMDVFLQNGKVCYFSPDGDAVFDKWLKFCEENHIDRVSRERMEEMVEDYFIHCETGRRFPEETQPSFFWTENELRKLLSRVELKRKGDSAEFRVEYRDGGVDFAQLPGSLYLRPLGNLIDTLIGLYNEYHSDIVMDFSNSI